MANLPISGSGRDCMSLVTPLATSVGDLLSFVTFLERGHNYGRWEGTEVIDTLTSSRARQRARTYSRRPYI